MNALKVALLLVVAAVLAACSGSPQSVSVEMGADRCSVEHMAVKPGNVTFNIHNPLADELDFVVKEDNDTHVVGQLLVHPGQTAPLTITFDHGDTYVTHCGANTGATFKP